MKTFFALMRKEVQTSFCLSKIVIWNFPFHSGFHLCKKHIPFKNLSQHNKMLFNVPLKLYSQRIISKNNNKILVTTWTSLQKLVTFFNNLFSKALV